MATQELVKPGICYMCTDNCPTKVHVKDGRITQIEMADERLLRTCPRWKAQVDFVYHPDRLKYPMKRVGERGSTSFKRISWDEALDTVAANLQKVKDEYGPESVVFWIAYTKEPRPYFHRLVHAFGSPNYCTESSNCFSGTWLASLLNYGNDYAALYIQGKTVDPASKCKLMWGTSVKNAAPQEWEEHVAAKKNGMKFIVVDPRRTELADMADIFLQLRPGSDGALALGMMKIIIDEGLYDHEFVTKWTNGFDDLRKLVQDYPLEKVAEITWVPAEKIRQAALMYATEKPAKLGFSGTSTTHHHNGVQNHRAITLLAALTGNLEVPGGNRWVPYGKPFPMNDITLHERVEQMPPGLGAERFPIWTKLYKEMEANVMASQIESGKPYPIKSVFGAGLNLMHFPNSNRLAAALRKLDFIAMTEYFHTPTTPLAEIVLPIASWLERQILVVKPTGYVTFIEPAIEPVGESRPEFDIYAELAKRLGFGDLFWDGDFEKSVGYILEPSGITLAELKQHPEGLDRPPTPRPAKYYEQAGFQTSSGKVEIASTILKDYGYEPLPVYKEPTESPLSRPDLAKDYPLVLTSGARELAYTHSQFRNISQLRRLLPDPLVDINPADAGSRGIKNGDTVIVSSPRASIKMAARVTDTILAGVVSLPHQWAGDANVNRLVADGEHLDYLSGFSPYKSQLCQVAKA